MSRAAVVGTLVAVAAAMLVAGAGASGKPARTIAAVDVLETQVLGELNAIRRRHGLVPLKLSRPLSTAADSHSRAMATHGFFAHESRDGTGFSTRVRRWYGPDGYRSWSVGENLLWSSARPSAAQALKLWMESPGHRRNILTPAWREIGLSAVSVKAAPGVYRGYDVVIITTDFGARS